ncbi:HNH endonuclease [Haloarchaeobius amylolyticus]|uniref:HNH endonuclease n=1 Tax=Haloarchaeobius amylolyticus TaxID=1198296 RepID=UPI0022707830|nr:HNH endonuclease [Haloarchaeobius amylolyticus]
MSRWRAVVRRELLAYRNQTGVESITLGDVYDQLLPVVTAEFPDNDHPKAKLRQVLQQLRDRDEVTFLEDGVYRLTGVDAGAVAGEPPKTQVEYTATTYETTVGARSISTAFRTDVLARYGRACPVSGVDHARLLDVAHILPWSEHEAHRSDPTNVLPLSKTHHAAFDAGLFTLDRDRRLWTAPDFDTESDLLRRTLLDREGTRIPWPETAPDVSARLAEHNAQLDWDVPA